MIENPVEKEISPELLPDEQIHWTAKPRQGLYLKSNDFVLIPLSLMWGGFAFFWEYTAVTRIPNGSPQPFFSVWGIPFCLMGIYLIIGRFFYDSYIRKNSFYAITNRRALIKRVLFPGRQELTSFQLSQLPQLTITKALPKFITIEFGPRTSGGRAVRPPTMEQVLNGEEALRLLQQK